MVNSSACSVATVTLNQDRELRVSHDPADSRAVADLRIFERFTPARVMMPTGRAIQIELAALPALAEALAAVTAGISGAKPARALHSVA
jgi:hypothetical protein